MINNQEPTIEELVRWSAEKLMEWERVYADGIPMWQLPSGRWDVINWQPDNRKTFQIWLVVDKMDKLGWNFTLHRGPGKPAIAIFSHPEKGAVKNTGEFCHATLLAAWRAVEGK